eukprot:TRINITY_DN15813_c0_g1_i1.p1 TRINITY_DN15813_c0_g1~~TRINITY_DN15813_c0_g1_i1.p1  ORF type:complete len:206 (+),score=42.32 TRINITY_DN15813_c0_g1_i1:116-733(+)
MGKKRCRAKAKMSRNAVPAACGNDSGDHSPRDDVPTHYAAAGLPPHGGRASPCGVDEQAEPAPAAFGGIGGAQTQQGSHPQGAALSEQGSAPPPPPAAHVSGPDADEEADEDDDDSSAAAESAMRHAWNAALDDVLPLMIVRFGVGEMVRRTVIEGDQDVARVQLRSALRVALLSATPAPPPPAAAAAAPPQASALANLNFMTLG